MNKIINFIKRFYRKLPNLDLKNNTLTKLVSLLLAILFWFFAMDQVNPIVSTLYEDIPVELINTVELEQKDYMIMSQVDYTADVLIEGRRNDVLAVRDEDIYLSADLKSVTAGQNMIIVNHRLNIENVDVKNVNPENIIINIDQMVNIPKKVTVDTFGEVPENYVYEGKNIIPEEVVVSGPESIVNTVSNLYGEVSLDGNTSNTTKEVAIVPVDSNGELVNGVTVEQSYVSVAIYIDKEKDVNVTTNINGSVAPGYEILSVTYNPIIYTINGAEETVDNFSKIYTEDINLSGTENATFTAYREIVAPSGISIGDQNPQCEILVVIEPIIAKEISYMENETIIENLDENFESNILEAVGEVTLTITDNESKVVNLDESDFSLAVDGSHISAAGLYNLEIEVLNVNQLYDSITVSPNSLSIEVSEKVDETLVDEVKETSSAGSD